MEVATTSSDVTVTSSWYCDVDNGCGEDDGWPLYVRILIGIMVVLVGVTNIIGNLLTIISFCLDRKLRSVANYYILNLAVTDLIIGVSSIPFYAVYTVLNFYWPFGDVYCKVWSVIDFWVCAESAVTICLISWDRLQMVQKGAGYANFATPRRAVVLIAVSWAVTFCLYSPAIIGFDLWRGYSTVEEDDCDVEFATDFLYTLITSCIEFLIPITLLAVFNTVLYVAIRKRSRRVAGAPAHAHAPVGQKGKKAGEADGAAVAPCKVWVTPSGQGKEGPPSAGVGGGGGTGSGTAAGAQAAAAAPAAAKKQADALHREKKALRSLTALVVVFLICWTPYTVSTIVMALCETCISEDVYEFFNWLLWVNSSLNALMYAFTNERFRDNYKRLLTCQVCGCSPRVPRAGHLTRVKPMKHTASSDNS